ncbi:MAG: substrate-binding domain-containing protein [Pseudomonadota bacterium]
MLTRRHALMLLLIAQPWMAQAQAQAQATPQRIAFVSHAPDSDTWWNTVRNAIGHAAADFGAEVDYLNPSDGSIAGMAQLLDGLSPTKYAGVISTIADFGVLADPLRAVVKRKLPLITVNSGTELQSEQVGALMHIGQPEFLAGKDAGEELAKKGARSFICFNHYPSNPASMERCEGFKEGLGKRARMVVVNLSGNPAENQATAAAALRQNSDVDAILTLGPTSAHPVLAGMLPVGKRQPALVTFDISQDIVAGIRSGTVAFAIDQQPYLQGYLSVALLAQSLRMPGATSNNLLKMSVYSSPKVHERVARYGLSLKYSKSRHIHSGPGFVSRLNIDKVERFSGQYR